MAVTVFVRKCISNNDLRTIPSASIGFLHSFLSLTTAKCMNAVAITPYRLVSQGRKNRSAIRELQREIFLFIGE